MEAPLQTLSSRPERSEVEGPAVPLNPKALPTAFAVVFKVYRNGATYRVDIDAATGAVLGYGSYQGLWTLNQGDCTISRVDTTSGKLVATIKPGFREDCEIA